jgi:trans-aconitate methyltransferase
LDLPHHCFLMMRNGRLFSAPLRNPQRVLDVGTGTGLWVMDFADEFPSAQVIGTDLSPIQPGWVPPNAQFYVEDLEADWVYGPNEAFDMVHARVMGGSVNDWDKFCRQAFTHLKSDGYLELQEPEAWMTSDDDTKDRAEFVNQFQVKCNEAAAVFGKELNLASTHKQRLIDAGFVDVRDEVMKVFLHLSKEREIIC